MSSWSRLLGGAGGVAFLSFGTIHFVSVEVVTFPVMTCHYHSGNLRFLSEECSGVRGPLGPWSCGPAWPSQPVRADPVWTRGAARRRGHQSINGARDAQPRKCGNDRITGTTVVRPERLELPAYWFEANSGAV